MFETILSVNTLVYLAPNSLLHVGSTASRQALWNVAVEHQGGGKNVS